MSENKLDSGVMPKVKMFGAAVVGEFLNPENWIKAIITVATIKAVDKATSKGKEVVSNRKGNKKNPPVKAVNS